MFKKLSLITLNLTLAFVLSSCQGEMNKQSSGRVIGGVAGGLLGSQFGKGRGQLVSVGVGVLAGTLIGNNIGKQMDEADKRMMYNTSQQALESAPTGQSIKWQNPDSGHYGYITPTKTEVNNGTVCREYQQEIIVGGKKEQGYGTACRQADGSWKIVK